ncbi:hypothetical protein STANM309S_06386 [Streptomyces tanashiensis]
MTARSIRSTAAVTVAGALALATAACSNPGSTAGGSGGPEDSAVVGIAYEPETLSPLLGYGKDGNSKIFDGLLAFDAGMRLKPALAVKLPRVTDGGLTYTYTLREGVTFSDGVPFTAKDVVYTYRTILDPRTNNPSRTELDALKSVDAVGDDTVVFHLKYPYAPFAERTVHAIAPEHVAAKQDVNTGAFTSRPIGTGPYVLTGWSKGEKLSFTANPTYWNGAPAVKKFTMAIIKDDDVRATRLRAGDLDGAILPPTSPPASRATRRRRPGRRRPSTTARSPSPPTTRSPATPPSAARSTSPSTAGPWSTRSSKAPESPPTGPSPPTAPGSPRAPNAATTSTAPGRSSTRAAGSPDRTASA